MDRAHIALLLHVFFVDKTIPLDDCFSLKIIDKDNGKLSESRLRALLLPIPNQFIPSRSVTLQPINLMDAIKVCYNCIRVLMNVPVYGL